MKYDFDTVINRRNGDSYKWKVRKDELPMWVADMDFKTAPQIMEVLQKRVEHGIFGYADIPEKWYDAYINWWDRRHNFKSKKEWLIFSSGVVPSISSCVRKFTTAGENVLIMTPVYNVFFNCIRNNGVNVVECPLLYKRDHGYDIDFKNLEIKLQDPQTTLMLLCNPQNPSGRIWNREELEKIGELAYKNDVLVLSDEIHCDITAPDAEYVPFASVSEVCRENSITCISPTKAFNIAGLHTSAVVVPNERIRHKMRRALNTDEIAEPNSFAVDAAVAAFEEGGEWLDSMCRYVYENKYYTEKFLKKEIPSISLVPSKATYLLWLDVSELKMTSKKLAAFIRSKTGLYLSHGEQYGSGENFLRMNIACPRIMLEDGLNRLKTAVSLIKP